MAVAKFFSCFLQDHDRGRRVSSRQNVKDEENSAGRRGESGGAIVAHPAMQVSVQRFLPIGAFAPVIQPTNDAQAANSDLQHPDKFATTPNREEICEPEERPEKIGERLNYFATQSLFPLGA